MGDELPPDPYQALGVAKDATAAAIKGQYRKLVLKCHPDKIQDESEKQNASDNFHKIQTAYEIISDHNRRARYDAQVKLTELRNDAMSSGHVRGGSDVRTGAFKVPTESARGGDFYARGPDRYGPRVTPPYEERRPSYARDDDEDYFGEPPRSAPRKRDEYERSSKRAPTPREEKPRSSARDVKENERSSRKEKSRRTERDVRRERERKFAPAEVESDSDSGDDYERVRRRMREEDDLRRAREQFYTTAEKQREESANGYFADQRAQKMFSQGFDARDYIERSTRMQPAQQSQPAQSREQLEPERRPSPPVRNDSSKEKITREYIKRKDKTPIMIRRGSGRPATTGRDTGKPSKSEKERRPSIEIVEEPVQEVRREERPVKPTLNQSKSSPADIRPVSLHPADARPSNRRQRSYTLQEEQHDPIPQIRRSDTMPPSPTTAAPAPRDSHRPKNSSKLRSESTRGLHPEDAYATPEATPEPESDARKYSYGQQYADDVEYPTPDGYRTEVREPQPQASRPRYTRSPSPLRERERESRSPRRQRSSSKQQTQAPPPMPRTTSRTYVYADDNNDKSSYFPRPAMSRENSSRLFGEVREPERSRERSTRSPRQGYTYSPPPESVRTQKEFRTEDVKFQTGYSRNAKEKPGYSRNSSGQQIRV